MWGGASWSVGRGSFRPPPATLPTPQELSPWLQFLGEDQGLSSLRAAEQSCGGPAPHPALALLPLSPAPRLWSHPGWALPQAPLSPEASPLLCPDSLLLPPPPFLLPGTSLLLICPHIFISYLLLPLGFSFWFFCLFVLCFGFLFFFFLLLSTLSRLPGSSSSSSSSSCCRW